MKTLWFSFFVLYALGTTEAIRLRGMLAAMEIYDQREHNAPMPTPEPLPVLPPTDATPKFHSPSETNVVQIHYDPPSHDAQPRTNRHSQIGSGR